LSLLIVDNLSRHFGAQEVLRGVTFQIDPGEKVGLVGRNGGGKTTLLELIEGLDKPDGGSVTLRKGARLGHVPQIPQFEPGQTVLAYVEGGLAEAKAVEAELARVNDAMEHAGGAELDSLVRRHDELTHALEQLGGWDLSHRVEKVLSGIGLPESFWGREARTLSGGERSRTALARELVAGHDLLLLDEPTNHLDLVGIEWIESWLRELKGAVLIVSHDRRMLSNCVDSILDLERGQVRRYPGSYEKYVTLKQERFASGMRAWELQQDFLSKEEAFIRKHMGSQRTAEAKGRLKKLEHIERLEKPSEDVRIPNIPPPKVERGGEMVLETKGLVGGYGERVLFKDLDLRIGRGQRIGVVGPNGAGKTTLLKILAGRTNAMRGEIDFGHKALCGYYDQDTSGLREDGTPSAEMRRVHPEWTDLEARSYLARFLFRGDEVEKSMAALSGGERARLCLAKLLSTPITWLAMDEPTNHLDLAARASLEELLGDFDGALICVSHDRAFLDGLCTHILEVGGGRATLHTGNYSDWRRRKSDEQAQGLVQREAQRKSDRAAEKGAQRLAEKQDEKQAEKQAEKGAEKAAPKAAGGGKVRNPWAFEKLEKRIMSLEEELKSLQASLVTEDVYRNAAKIREAQMRIAECERELEAANEEWMNWA
jgi:ATP-binding cassette subfamily F protein 3